MLKSQNKSFVTPSPLFQLHVLCFSFSWQALVCILQTSVSMHFLATWDHKASGTSVRVSVFFTKCFAFPSWYRSVLLYDLPAWTYHTPCSAIYHGHEPDERMFYIHPDRWPGKRISYLVIASVGFSEWQRKSPRSPPTSIQSQLGPQYT